MSAPRPEHADDLLSAHLDGELDPELDAWVVEHTEACAGCREAAAELSEARALLRGLPTVDGTPVIEGLLARHRTVVRVGLVFVGVAAVVLAALGATGATHRTELVPDLAGLRAMHESGSHTEMGGMEEIAGGGGGGYAAPPGLIGSAVRLSRQAVYDGEDLTAVVYRDADIHVTVYQQPGRLDWDRLPAGETAPIGDQPVWFGPGTPVVAVTERGDMVVTVVSDERAAVLTAVAGLPEWRRRATWDRMHDACQRFTRVFALGG